MSTLFTALSPLFVEKNLYEEKKLYELAISQNKLGVYIKMSMHTSHYHTNYFPDTLTILKNQIPSVLTTKCFNKNNYSFDREVLNTEIGHLFEHILLQNLCDLKLASGSQKAVYKGLTQWDWTRDAKGTFHITLSVDTNDWGIFPNALNKTEEIVKQILSSPTQISIN